MSSKALVLNDILYESILSVSFRESEVWIVPASRMPVSLRTASVANDAVRTSPHPTTIWRFSFPAGSHAAFCLHAHDLLA